MTESSKIQDSISRSAALALYLVVAGFFVIIALLGAAEQLARQPLILPISSLTLVLVCSVISIGFIAVVFQWHHVRWMSAVLTLLLLAYIIWVRQQHSMTFNRNELSGVPLPLLVLLLALSAAALIMPLTSRMSRHMWKLLSVLTLGYGCYLQFSLWFLQAPTTNQTPFSLSLVPVMLITGGVALALRQHFQLTAAGWPSRSTLIAILMFQTGYGVWFSLSLSDVKFETRLAEQRIHQVVQQVHQQLQIAEKLFVRASARWELIASEQRMAFMTADLHALTDAYTVVHGVMVFDDNLTPIIATGKANDFYQQGLLAASPVRSWLADVAPSHTMATNRASLSTPYPFLMHRLNVTMAEGDVKLVLVFINLHQALALDSTYNGSQLKTFLEVLPNVLLSADGSAFQQATFTDLQQKYHHFHKVTPSAANWNGTSFYVFVADTKDLLERSRLHQVVLWVALVLCITFVLAADRTRQLHIEKAKLFTLAKFDDITGLLRRDAFYQAMEDTSPKAKDLPEAMIFIDLDGFKPINDSFGHDVGDKLLAEIASRIRLLVGENTLLARFSGDEFLIYTAEGDAATVTKLAEALLVSLAKPSSATGFNVYLTASIGIVINHQLGQSSQLLTQLADVAMSYAKLAGGNTYRFYQQSMADDYRNIMAMRNRLQAALDARALRVFYQPVISFTTGRVIALESLVRWYDQGRFIPPVEFIAIAEQTGQIIQLGEQVTEMVLRDLAEQPALAHLSAAINVSSQQLRRYDFVGFLAHALQRFDIPAQRICVELTESALLEEQSNAFLLPERIKQLGCLLALDDFGTGYSSLSYLYRLPADSIKLDRSFTQDLLLDDRQRKIVEMIVSTCKHLGKTVVIEGVETAEMADICRELGCDRVQGYYYAKPMALADLLVYLAEQRV